MDGQTPLLNAHVSTTTTTTTTQLSTLKVAFFFVEIFSDGCRRAGSCPATEAATTALVVATREADGGCGAGHVSAPLCPTRTEDGQDQREEVVSATHDGDRRHLRGMRPAVSLRTGPQRSDRSLRRFSGDAPLLGVPSLAGSSAEAIDVRTLRFLLAQNQLEEDEKERKWGVEGG